MSVANDSLHSRLRRATRPLHDRFESRLDFKSKISSRENYLALLCCMYCLYKPLEDALRLLDWSASGMDSSACARAHLLEADLNDLGVNSSAILTLPLCTTLPAIKSMGAAVGVLYVLQGSTLGGQVILTKASNTLAISPQCGGRFFNGHGNLNQILWCGFLSTLERYREPSEVADAVERAAVDTFMMFYEWFSDIATQSNFARQVALVAEAHRNTNQ